MRQLQTKDIFSAARLLSKIGVREELREVAKEVSEGGKRKTQFDLGFELLFGIIEKATNENSEKEIYIFIADLFECEWETVRDMDPIEMFDKLEEVASVEKWKDFFGRVAKLMKRKLSTYCYTVTEI